MRKTILAICLLLCKVGYAQPQVDERVLKAFDAAFPNVVEERWFEEDDCYEASFQKDQIRCTMRYTREGQIISTRRYYGKELVTPFLIAKLAQKYPAKSIFGVTEIQSEDGLLFQFVLEDARSWTLVQSDPTGFMVVTNQFKKAL